jgi:hypothetical protein
MKTAILVPLACAFILTACSGESQFPEPTGKGTFRSINAISTSPVINFRLEEVNEAQIEQASYRGVTSSLRFDDFEYNFNFEVSYPGELQRRRVATVTQKIDAGRDYTFVTTGAVENPTVLTWIGDERFFEGDEDVAEIRFAHLAESLGTVDFYFAPAGTPPAAGAAEGTLAFGEFLEARDFDSGVYRLTVTPAGDPETILYQSVSANFPPLTTQFVAIFDGTRDETSPVVGRILATQGGTSFTLRDIRNSSTLRIIQGSRTLDTVDVYADETLQDQVVAGLPFQGTSEEFDISEGDTNFFFTPAGSTGAVLLEGTVSSSAARRFEQFSLGNSGELITISAARDTQPVEIYATLTINNTSVDEQVVDVYVVDPGEAIADVNPDFAAVYAFASGRVPIEAGTYDVIVTATGSKVPLAKTEITVANGDVERFTLFETDDPNVLAILPQP